MKTKFDILKFLNDYQIYYTDKGSNCSLGWVNIKCPICNDSSEHLGFNLENGAHSCWKSSTVLHTLKDIIMGITLCNEFQSRKIIRKYSISGVGVSVSQLSHQSQEPSVHVCSLPPETAPLISIHKKYLAKRNFNHKSLVFDWDIMGTKQHGSYRFRIIIPIYLKGRLVSYQSRDITGKATLRYKACPIDETVISHKSTLYGIDKTVGKRKIIIVEGPFDVMRLNTNNPGVSVSTFGTKTTDKQILMLTERFDVVNILFDSSEKDKDALTNAKNIAEKITALGKQSHIFNLTKGDPADLSQKEADNIVAEIQQTT